MRVYKALTQEIPDTFYHATYKELLPEIKKKGLDTRKVDLAWEDSVAGIIYLANDLDAAASYAEIAEEVPAEIYDSGIIVLHIPSKGLDLERLHDDRNVRSDEASDTYEYHSQIPWNKVKKVTDY